MKSKSKDTALKVEDQRKRIATASEGLDILIQRQDSDHRKLMEYVIPRAQEKITAELNVKMDQLWES